MLGKKTRDEEELLDELDDDDLLTEDDDPVEEEEERVVHRGSSGLSFLSGILVGALIGAGVTLLTAPARGEVTRRRVTRRLRDIQDDTRDHVDDLRSAAQRRLLRQRSRRRRRAQRVRD